MKLSVEESTKDLYSLKPRHVKIHLVWDHDKHNVHTLVASVGGVRVDEGLLLDDPAEGLELVLGLLGEGPHVDLALVVVSAVLWAGDLLKIFLRVE